jgi:hypothetical protein
MIKTIAGPFTREAAEETAAVLDNRYSAYGVSVDDAYGYVDDVASDANWYVELDDSIVSNRIMGMSWEQIQAKQQGTK